MSTRITNIEEIRKKVKKIKALPKNFRISSSEVISDPRKFIESHLIHLDIDKLFRKHRAYHDRLKKLLDELGIEIKIEKKDDKLKRLKK